MTVFGEDDLTSQARVLKSGEASFPLIGLVKVGGLTVAEATVKLRELYAQDYLVDPKVSLTVESYAQEFVSVVGAVTTPGQVPIPATGTLDLAAALAAAGGLAPAADPNRITLTRPDGTSTTLSLQTIQADGGPELGAGDRIITYISPFAGKIVTIRGQVRRPGPLALPIDGKLDIVTALALAGDFTELANPRKITLSRGGRNILLSFPDLTADGAPKFYLESGDVIQVAERFF
jgi:polysaccharide export outer membrane protein